MAAKQDDGIDDFVEKDELTKNVWHTSGPDGCLFF
jgi:hypothetical protein